MRGTATEKVAGGKLLRIKVDYSDVIKNISITGDFFLHPEEGVEKIESALAGTSIDDENSILKTLNEVIRENNIELIGIDVGAIVRNIRVATGEAK